ncbi:MAG: DnaA regulatory inactivator Hda [Gammaproteobacteria bacterium]|nr:DnaA regulatory inactivator Hda [Gammaproteobacteria bacterium]
MTEQMALPFSLGERCRFDQFVLGRNGELVDRLRGSGRGPRRRFDCLWLFGEPGTGKTHLLQAVCLEAANAVYIPAREIDARDDTIVAYGKFDVVTVDDVTGWIGVEESERSLMDLYNVLRVRQARLVFTADRSPRDLDFSLPDLGSRLRAAACYRVHPLDDRDKMRLLRAVASERGLELPDDVARFLLARTSRDQGELVSVFDRLDRTSLALGRRVTIPFVKQTLGL